MMKKNNLYIMLLAGILFFGACSESFLDSEPITSLTEANFYRTKKDAEMAIVGCYDGLQMIYTTQVAFPVLSMILADEGFGGTGANDDYKYQLLDEFDLSRSPAEVNVLNENWEFYYRAIYRVNVLLSKMEQIDWEGDDAYKNSIESQARFLRAYFYFDMVRLWEKVPLVTAPTEENISQSEPNEIYELIADDLIFAAENGMEEVLPGRINKWVAKAYLARVFLFYTGYYGKDDLVGKVAKNEVLAGLEEVIAKGEYELIDEYKDLWPAASAIANVVDETLLETTYAGKDNKETLFAIKHNITSNYNGDTDGNHWMVMLGLREQAFSPYGRGWGACTVNPKLYNDYEAGDARKVATIIAVEEEGLDFDVSGQREYTGYSSKKYSPLSLPDKTDVAEANNAVNFMIGQYQDYVVIRYADVLLMAAELGSANAQEYFDQVRGRAGLASKAVSKKNMMQERRFEFALEGVRYWDLLRQGVDVAAQEIAETTTLKTKGEEVEKVINKSKIVETRGFQMIPHNQITLSGGVLKQNQGWE